MIPKIIAIAEIAGLPNVETTSEPEAAGMFMIHKALKPWAKNSAGFLDKIIDHKPYLNADVGGSTGVSQLSDLWAFSTPIDPTDQVHDTVTNIVGTPDRQTLKINHDVTGEGLSSPILMTSVPYW